MNLLWPKMVSQNHGVSIGGVVMNALAFKGTDIFFSKLMNHGKKERKRHDLAFEKH